MRITNDNNIETPFYVGTCKNNNAPKHIAGDNVETKKVKLDKKAATMFNSPKTEYIYIKHGESWLWVKDKSIFGQDSLTTTKITRKPNFNSVANQLETND